jgi:hypothetical protein
LCEEKLIKGFGKGRNQTCEAEIPAGRRRSFAGRLRTAVVTLGARHQWEAEGTEMRETGYNRFMGDPSTRHDSLQLIKPSIGQATHRASAGRPPRQAVLRQTLNPASNSAGGKPAPWRPPGSMGVGVRLRKLGSLPDKPPSHNLPWGARFLPPDCPPTLLRPGPLPTPYLSHGLLYGM